MQSRMRWGIAVQICLSVINQLGCSPPPKGSGSGDGSADDSIQIGADAGRDGLEDVKNKTERSTDGDMETAAEDEDTPSCPWECMVLDDSETCSVLNENWIHNTKFDCAESDSICCQPLGAPGGLEEDCTEQPAMSCAALCTGDLFENQDYYCQDASRICCQDPNGPDQERCAGNMACRKTCIDHEQQNTEYYCDRADLVCCHDPRPLCRDIGGVCTRSLLGTCPNGKQKNNKGICKGDFVNCCTDIAKNNRCAKNRGKCVNWGKSCPLLYIPNPFTSCGNILKMCCGPIL